MENRPDSLFEIRFARVNYLTHIDDKNRLVYVETPKVACTSIKKLMMDQYCGGNFELDDPSKVHDRNLSPLKQLSQILPEDLDEIWSDNYRRFSFVRNPYTRLLSGYLDKLINNEYERNRHLPLMGFESGYYPTLLEFLERLVEMPDEKRDIHFVSQSSLLMLDYVEYQFIGHFENFRDDFLKLQKDFYGKEGDPQHYESFGTHHASNANSKFNEYYGKAELDLVRQIYQNDFEKLCYPEAPEYANLFGRRLCRPKLGDEIYELAFTLKPEKSEKDSKTSELGKFDEAWQKLIGKQFDLAGELFLETASELEPSALAHRSLDSAFFCKLRERDVKDGIGSFFQTEHSDRLKYTLKPIAEAIFAVQEGDWQKYWSIASTLPAFEPSWFGPWNRGLHTRPEFVNSIMLQNIAEREVERLEIQPIAEADSEPVILMAADSKYFIAHASFAINSYRDVGGEEQIVIAVINPTEDARELAERLIKADKKVEIRFYENSANSRAYFASARYIYAAEIMKEFRRPVFVFDIDVAFLDSGSNSLAKQDFDETKIGLRLSENYTLPWQKIDVSAMYLPYSFVGINFAFHLHHFLKLHFSIPNNADLKWIDRNAALSAYLAVERSTVQRLIVRDFLLFPSH